MPSARWCRPAGSRNRGDAVRLLDRERDHAPIRRIAANQRDVGAVQRRHRPRRAIAGDDASIWSREIRRRGMRHRVVRVDDVEPVLLARPARSCWSVRAGTAARGTADRSGTSTGSNDSPGTPERQRNGGSLLMTCTCVAAIGQRVRQLGRDDAAAADRRVADHADVHGTCFKQSRPHTARARRSLRRRPRRPARRTARRGSRPADGTSTRSAGSVTAPSSGSVNWLRWQSSAARLRS